MNILAHLRALWNYDPVAMQKAMLLEVWARWLSRDLGVRRNWAWSSAKEFEPGFTRIYLTNADFDEPSEAQQEIDRRCALWSYDSPYNYRRVQ